MEELMELLFLTVLLLVQDAEDRVTSRSSLDVLQDLLHAGRLRAAGQNRPALGLRTQHLLRFQTTDLQQRKADLSPVYTQRSNLFGAAPVRAKPNPNPELRCSASLNGPNWAEQTTIRASASAGPTIPPVPKTLNEPRRLDAHLSGN